MSLAHEIVDIFEQLLEEKGIEVPCKDATEQDVRHDGGNTAKLYGMEYANLVDKIESLLSDITCNPSATAECGALKKNGELNNGTVPAAIFQSLDHSKKPVQIAMHQIKLRLLCLADECNGARIKACREKKIDSEIQLHASMQHIYSQLAKLIPDENSGFCIAKSSLERIAENAFERMKEKNEEDVITSVKDYVEKWLTEHGYTYTLKLHMCSRLQWYVYSDGKDIPDILLISEPQSEEHLLEALDYFDKKVKKLNKKEAPYEKY